MGFHDVRLPTRFSEGSQFGPGFSTRIIELDSMAEHRIRRGPDSGRRTYSLERGISNLDDLYELYEFYVARQGALNSFRLKDWLDYATTPTGTTHRDADAPVAYDDEDLEAVDGSTTVFQFVKRYVSGPTTVVRTLHKLVDGTVKVGDSTGELLSGFTLDLQNGRVTFSSAPTGQVTGGCEFDVSARFSQETDRAFQVAIEAVDTGNLPEIRCVEDVEPVTASQDFPHGGAKHHGVITANVSLSEFDGRLQIAAPSTTGKKFILPDVTDLPTGGPYFVLINDGSQAMEIETSAGVDVVNPFAVGAIKELWLSLNSSGTKTWRAL